LKSNLSKLIVYGSYARGDYKEKFNTWEDIIIHHMKNATSNGYGRKCAIAITRKSQNVMAAGEKAQ